MRDTIAGISLSIHKLLKGRTAKACCALPVFIVVMILPCLALNAGKTRPPMAFTNGRDMKSHV